MASCNVCTLRKFIIRDSSSFKLRIDHFQYALFFYLAERFVITTGVGNHQMMTAQYIEWTEPNQLISSGSLGTMGSGVPFSIGCALAERNRNDFMDDCQIICIDGDSSFNMSFTDLRMIAEHKLPIKIFIMNDGRQQMVYVWQKLFHDEKYVGTINSNPNYEFLSKAFGLEYHKISQFNDFTKIEQIMKSKEPIVVECCVEPDYCLPFVAPGASLDETITDSHQLELLIQSKGTNESPC